MTRLRPRQSGFYESNGMGKELIRMERMEKEKYEAPKAIIVSFNDDYVMAISKIA